MHIDVLAAHYADLNVFNHHTRDKILTTAKLFVVRSEVRHIEQVSLEVLARFKQKTLTIAKPVTYNGYLRYLRILGDHAVTLGLVEKNAFRSIKLAPVGVTPTKTMDSQSVQSLTKHILTYPLAHEPYWFWLCVIYCLHYTGMRRRQLVELRRSDIDLARKTIFLSYQGSKTHREWVIPMHSELAIRFTIYFAELERVMGRRLYSEEFVFDITRLNARYTKNPSGGMKPEAITGFFKRLGGATGIRVGPHRFRHTFATMLCNPSDNSSPDIFAAQSILGHTNLQTTRGYVKTSIGRMEEALKKIGAPVNNDLSENLT